MAINFPEGTQDFPTKIVQVQQTIYTGVWSASGNWSTVTSLDCSITPKSSSNKILVMLHVGAASYSSNTMVFELLRDGTRFYSGNADANRVGVSARIRGRGGNGDNNHCEGVNITTVDTPATTASRTYRVRITGEGRNQQMYINREINSSNSSDPAQSRGASTMTLMEFIP
jgi:hypothetical protein